MCNGVKNTGQPFDCPVFIGKSRLFHIVFGYDRYVLDTLLTGDRLDHGSDVVARGGRIAYVHGDVCEVELDGDFDGRQLFSRAVCGQRAFVDSGNSRYVEVHECREAVGVYVDVADVLAVADGAFVYSLGPSIVNAVFPLLANFLFTQTVDGVKIMGINALDTYRWIVPLLAAVCYAFALIAAFGTKERMMIAKVYVQRVKFLDGVRKTVQNKYFWINNLHRLWENLKVVGASFFIWVCTYMLQNEFAQSIVVTVMGTASVPGMLLAPMLIKRIGVRKLVVISNILLVVFTLPICFFPNPWLILVAGYMVTLAFGVQIVTNSLMMAQTYDYQQFKTGDRMEGFLSQFGEILIQVTTIAVAYIGPAISKAYGYFDDATVLYRPEVIEPIIQLNCVVAAGSAVLAVLSMLLWDLTDKKHAQIMDVLGVRALKEDGVIEEGEANVLETKILAGDEEAIRLAKEMIHRNEELRAEGKIKKADAGTN